MRQYLRVFANRNYLLFWSGFTVSQLGDGLTWIALIWMVYKLTGSTATTGLLLVFYTAPTIVGGLFAGSLLDRYGRKRMMILDNVVRGLFMAAIPLLYWLGKLEVWHLFLAATVFGALMMISLAGGPALVPSLVDESDLNTVNALESMSWSLSDVVGRALGGILVAVMGAPYVIAIDALTYFVFAACLMVMHVPESAEAAPGAAGAAKAAGNIGTAFRFVWTNKLILSITLIFMVVNLGGGAFGVVLPVYSDTVLHQGAQGFGFLTASNSLGQLVSSTVVGAVAWPFALGISIGIALILSGASFLGLLVPGNLALAGVFMFLFGLLFAPINIWAQTIRMKVIPAAMRGRVFAILRTVIRSTVPLSAAVVGLLLPLLGVTNSIILVGGLIVLAGIGGLFSPAMVHSEQERASA